MKRIAIILIGIAVLIMILSQVKDLIVKVSVEKMVKVVTGLDLNIRSLNMGIIRSYVRIRGLRLYNPKGYEDKIMLDMPEIYADYKLLAIFKRKLYIEEMRINLKELVVVKNKDGELNLNCLKVVKLHKEGKSPQRQDKGKVPELKIDNLQLKIGRAIYKDYSTGKPPRIKEFNINLDEKFSNITDLHSLITLVMAKALRKTTIARLTNFDMGLLKDTVTHAVERAKKAAKGTLTVAEGAAKKTAETFKKFKKTAESIIPFGREQQ